MVEIFFKLHDPTTLNRQGADVGEQYRSVIFYHNDEQKKIAESVLGKFEQDKVYEDPIVTKITRFSTFYKAEDYHQNYYERNKEKNPYCRIVIDPKITKLYKDFRDKLKD